MNEWPVSSTGRFTLEKRPFPVHELLSLANDYRCWRHFSAVVDSRIVSNSQTLIPITNNFSLNKFTFLMCSKFVSFYSHIWQRGKCLIFIHF